MGAGLRVWLLGLLCVAAWALGGQAPSRVAAGNAPPTEFSAVRAEAMLARLLGPQHPHPAGSAEGGAVQARLLAELARLGVPARSVTGMSCENRRGFVACSSVSNVIAEAVPGTGKAVLLMAHRDSVAAGPGASDDMSGVATLLETIRALRAQGGATPHPVIALFSDGEESGLLGAQLFLRDAAQRARIGVVINAEARGTNGPSYLFQTSRGDGRLIDIYARGAAHPAASSLYGEIYKYLPNDTDLTPFLRAGFSGYNFAFIGNAAAYHTALDRRENLSSATLQSQGDNVLGLVRSLEGADLTALKSGNAIYFDVLGMWLPRLPQSFAVPLAIGAFVLIALAGWLTPRAKFRDSPRPGGPLAGFLMPPLLLLGCVAAGFAMSALAGWISGQGDPSFAHPLALRIALGFAVWAMALLTMRGASALCCWLWLAGLGIGCAAFAPGFSPYFIFPTGLAALLLVLTPGAGRGAALFLAALAMMIVWLGLTASTEPVMGLAAHPLFTMTAGIALIALLPVLAAQNMTEGFWRFSILASLLIALGAAVTAGFEPAYSAAAPLRLNLRYVEKDGKAWLLADPVGRLPEGLRASANFSQEPGPLVAWRGYVAPLGNGQFPAPSATVTRSFNHLTLDLHGSHDAEGMLLLADGLTAVTIGGVREVTPEGRVTIACGTTDCATAHLVLEFARVPGSLLLAETRHGLPQSAARMAKARPDWAMPSGQGDVTFIATDVAVPKD